VAAMTHAVVVVVGWLVMMFVYVALFLVSAKP
jgi:hypothetical protein